VRTYRESLRLRNTFMPLNARTIAPAAHALHRTAGSAGLRSDGRNAQALLDALLTCDRLRWWSASGRWENLKHTLVRYVSREVAGEIWQVYSVEGPAV